MNSCYSWQEYILRIHCFNSYGNHSRYGQCLDMEISFYVECFEQNEKFIPWCLTVDLKVVDFTFRISDEIDIIETSQLWASVESILSQSFGTITVEVSIKDYQKSQMNRKRSRSQKRNEIFVINIKPIRQPSKSRGHVGENLEALLLNDKIACENFLGTRGEDCWSEHARVKFLKQGITYIGHELKTSITEGAFNNDGS